jgi:hypothetical protein
VASGVELVLEPEYLVVYVEERLVVLVDLVVLLKDLLAE